MYGVNKEDKIKNEFIKCSIRVEEIINKIRRKGWINQLENKE